MSTSKNGPFEIVDRRKIKETQQAPGDPAAENQAVEAITPAEFTKDELESLYSGRKIQTVERVYDDPLPIFNHVLIRRMAKETVYGGTRFVIPESAQQSPNRGVVVATAATFIWEGKSFPMSDQVKVGDLVVFGAFNTEDIKVGDEIFTLCSVWDIKLVESCHFAVEKP
jgi:co-chaperonin GroES (HSP10)